MAGYFERSENFRTAHVYRVTNTRCRIDTVFSPDDGHIVARNMYRKAINILRKFVHQVGSIYKMTQTDFLISKVLQYNNNMVGNCLHSRGTNFSVLRRLALKGIPKYANSVQVPFMYNVRTTDQGMIFAVGGERLVRCGGLLVIGGN